MPSWKELTLAGNCEQCGQQRWQIGTAKTANGATVHPYYCGSCGHRPTGLFEKKDVAQRIGCDVALEFRWAHLADARVCEVCGSTKRVESHHWAPRHLFGAACDRWPTSLLCHDCHTAWHKIVTPTMTQPTD